jgi:hypothetical protein
MSVEAEQFYRKERMDAEKTPRMKNFFRVSEFPNEGKIMEKYAKQYSKTNSNAAFLNAKEMTYENFVKWWDEQRKV